MNGNRRTRIMHNIRRIKQINKKKKKSINTKHMHIYFISCRLGESINKMSASSGRKTWWLVKRYSFLHKWLEKRLQTYWFVWTLSYHFFFSMSFIFVLHLNHRNIQLTEEWIVMCWRRKIKHSLVVIIVITSWFVTATICFVSVISFLTLLVRTWFRIDTSIDVGHSISLAEIAVIIVVILVK